MMPDNVRPLDLSQQTVASLIALGRSDTLYHDLYLQRARSLLQEHMSLDGYRAHKRDLINLANLPNQIRNAMNDGNWPKVRELSKQHKSLSEEINRTKPLATLGKAVYESQDIPIDPFSPGLRSLSGVSNQNLDDLRNDVLGRLDELSRLDSEWQGFYARRTAAFAALSLEASSLDGTARPSMATLQDEAVKALETGNFDKLEELADDLSEVQGPASGTTMPGSASGSAGPAAQDLPYPFSAETIKQAQALGLALHRVTSRHEEFAPLCRFAWHPTFAMVQDNHSGVLRVPDLPMPEGTPEGLRARVQLFASHPMINSAGVRFLPTLVAEDALVEDFNEPASGSDAPQTGLLRALGLAQRNQLSRLQIEAILLEKGEGLLRNELSLEPVDFKLVCIPPDLHLRIGLERGWGQQKIWTHFDGYMVMADGRLWALAGGDVRYGGIFDLLGIARNYDSDRVIARFAVVQRQRLAIPR